jgi:hypothetical protein
MASDAASGPSIKNTSISVSGSTRTAASRAINPINEEG